MQRSKRLLVTGGKIEFPAQIRLQNLCGGVLCFFGAPLDLGGGPLDLPWGASGRLGGDFPADGPPSSQPAWGDPPAKKISAPAAGFVFFKIFRRPRRALFFQFFSAPAAGFVF